MSKDQIAGFSGVPITFNNTIYNAGKWGVIYMFQNLGTVDYVSPDRIVLNGSISQIGDRVSVIYNDATYQFTVTAYDNSGALVLQYGSNLYVIANSTLTRGQVLTLTTDGPGEYAPPPCFVEGTRILTRTGEVPVESLVPGDDVVAVLAGQLLPVIWVGRRTIVCTREDRPAEMWPFQVRAHAFGPGRPHRDLYLSPDHAIHVDGMLVPVRYLENGTTIRRERRDSVTYYHVELARHDILLSDGLGSESYLDTGNRDDFVRLKRSPGQSMAEAEAAARQIWADRGCMELVTEGIRLRTTRTKLAARAASLGHAASDDPGLVLRAGTIDHRGVFDGEAWHFALDTEQDGARLVSTGFVPAMVAQGGVAQSAAGDGTPNGGARDRRCLGVAVTRLMADGRIVPLHHPALSRGWHQPEGDLRWTAGEATLPRLHRLSVVLAPIGRTAAHPRLAAPAPPRIAPPRSTSSPAAHVATPPLERARVFSHTGGVRITPGGRERPWGAAMPFIPPPKAQPAPGNAQASKTVQAYGPLESRPAEQAAPTE